MTVSVLSGIKHESRAKSGNSYGKGAFCRATAADTRAMAVDTAAMVLYRLAMTVDTRAMAYDKRAKVSDRNATAVDRLAAFMCHAARVYFGQKIPCIGYCGCGVGFVGLFRCNAIECCCAGSIY
ncbi:MAG: hypothetical protein CFE23_14385 [Flavobacterium sp. BFFFF1]|uniref:hypothetical protein n=1 Tax=Flavobacterium sp. BFFFF1 TaxID=2015557 RepID=UPI000BCC0C0F|nr:hypothetical protein [Flavobacterium sp. BFFFF1]OYU79353.1 MAG: hypothetical protein CFE23_14385 [Flavobacterium sp. BFFFF1]